MKLRTLAIGAAAALGVLAVPQMAAAAWGTVTGASALNLRACASASCARVAVMPYGARVWIDGTQGGWYHLTYNGIPGYASGRYITTAMAGGPPVYHGGPPPPPPVAYRPPPPTWGYYQRPWWDPHYGAWYDGRRWYFSGRWYTQPSGFSFGFRIGG